MKQRNKAKERGKIKQKKKDGGDARPRSPCDHSPPPPFWVVLISVSAVRWQFVTTLLSDSNRTQVAWCATVRVVHTAGTACGFAAHGLTSATRRNFKALSYLLWKEVLRRSMSIILKRIVPQRSTISVLGFIWSALFCLHGNVQFVLLKLFRLLIDDWTSSFTDFLNHI
jgi:hypothetical protein